jgi:hypothetical protein
VQSSRARPPRWADECGGGRLLIVVSITQRFCGHSRQAGAIAAQCREAAYMNRFVVVEDDDFDPTNLEEVVWAMCTRCDPAEDIDILRKAWGSRADPMLQDGQPPYNSRAIIDACRPFEWIKEFPRVAEGSPELLRQVETQWADVFAHRPGQAPGVGGVERAVRCLRTVRMARARWTIRWRGLASSCRQTWAPGSRTATDLSRLGATVTKRGGASRPRVALRSV